jgi:hypothetical protein
MGRKRSCIKFKKTMAKTAKGRKAAFRCVEYKEGLKHPKLPPGKLKGGGRSQNYIRPGVRT